MQSNTETFSRAGNVGRGIFFFLAGSALGAGAALLFAPKPGSELRSDIAETAKSGYDGAVDLVHKVKDESTNFYRTLVDRKNDVLDLAGNAINETKDQVSDAVRSGKNKADKALSDHASAG